MCIFCYPMVYALLVPSYDICVCHVFRTTQSTGWGWDRISRQIGDCKHCLKPFSYWAWQRLKNMILLVKSWWFVFLSSDFSWTFLVNVTMVYLFIIAYDTIWLLFIGMPLLKNMSLGVIWWLSELWISLNMLSPEPLFSEFWCIFILCGSSLKSMLITLFFAIRHVENCYNVSKSSSLVTVLPLEAIFT